MSVTSTAFEIEPPEVESSSSIGKNSDEEEVGSRSSASDEENETQSRYSGRLYEMEELEHVLPMRRGISKFYNGKSNSFASLADASATSSIQEIVKPENMYARRRRNLLAFNHVWDSGQSSSPRKGNATGGISKRPLRSSKSTLALAVAMTHSESYSYSSARDDSTSSNFSRRVTVTVLGAMIPVLATSHSPPTAIHFTHKAKDPSTITVPLGRRTLHLGCRPSQFHSKADLRQQATPIDRPEKNWPRGTNFR